MQTVEEVIDSSTATPQSRSVHPVDLTVTHRPHISNYQRFSIKNQHCDHRKQAPNPFYPKVGRIGLAKLLVKEILSYNFKLVKSDYRKLLFSRPCIYGVFSGPVGGFAPIHQKCTGCMRCVEEFPYFVTVDRNPEFARQGDSYWLPEDPSKMSFSPHSSVLWEAMTGGIPVRGMGFKGKFGGKGWNTMFADMSEIVRPTRDGILGREFISTEVNIGRKYERIDMNSLESYSKPLKIPFPIIFDYLPDHLSSPLVQQSIKQSAEATGTLFLASEHQIENLGKSKNWIYKPLRDFNEDHFSILAEISAIEFNFQLHGFDLIQQAVEYIGKQNLKTKIIVKLPFGLAYEIYEEMIHAGVDAFHLAADYHGNYQEQGKTKFIIEGIRDIHTHLVAQGLRDRVTIIASGGITLAEHVSKAILCGVDLIAINTTILVALQLDFLGELTDHQSGKIAVEGFSTVWGRQRLINVLSSWYNQTLEILSAMGMRDIRRMRGDVGRAIFQHEIEKEAFGDIDGY